MHKTEKNVSIKKKKISAFEQQLHVYSRMGAMSLLAWFTV